MTLNLNACALDMPEIESHTNRLPFEGILTLVDEASDKAPAGARGHRVILTLAAAQAALPSLMGMAVDFRGGWDGHDARQKCGIITSAVIEENRIKVAGFIYDRDFPEVSTQCLKAEMGMSYELADAHVKDMREEVWSLTKAHFSGAAVLLREKCAYRSTSFQIIRKGEAQ